MTITARLRDSERPVLDKESFISDGVRQVYSINTEQIATLTGVPLAGSYLQLVDDQPGGLGVIGLPHLDAGPFLSYGIQWITFGIVAPILLGYFVYAEVRARRAEKSVRHRRANARRSRRPSRTSSPTATDGGAEHRERQHRRSRLHRTRKPHGAAQIGHRWRRTRRRGPAGSAVVVVLGRPAEAHAQRPGEGRLHHAGVGARMAARRRDARRVTAPAATRRRAARTPTASAAVTRAAT